MQCSSDNNNDTVGPSPSSSTTAVAAVRPKANNKSGNKTELSETAFRLAEKKYKLFRLDARAAKRQSVEASDFSDVVDFHQIEKNTEANQKMMRLVSEIKVPVISAAKENERDATTKEEDEDEEGGDVKRLRSEGDDGEMGTTRTKTDTAADASSTSHHRTQRCYTFDGVPGLLFFPSALSEAEQQYWCGQALNRYAQSPPFPNNLTTLDPTLETKRYGGPHVQKKKEEEEDGETKNAIPSPSPTSSPNIPQQQQQQPAKEKMRWATLGFKYNWTTKSYSPSEYCLFPADLSKMIKDTFFTMLAPVAANAISSSSAPLRSGEGEDVDNVNDADEGADAKKKDALAVALATAKAVELAKGLQLPCRFAAAAAAAAADNNNSNNSGCGGDGTGSCAAAGGGCGGGNNEEMVSVGGMLVKRSELFVSGATSPSAGLPSLTSNPANLPSAAPITLLANAVAASHKEISTEEILSALLSPSYEPQTAIVNYFPTGTMMCAHQDLSEPCLHRPLISVSLGASCVFLMGTTSREDKPHAFLLRSGDIVAFTGPSRVAFHAVPRVVEDSCPQHLMDFDSRMKGLRININVRQVYDEPQPQLAEE